MSGTKGRHGRRRRKVQMDKRNKPARKARARRQRRSKQRRRERDRRVTELYGQSGHRSCGRKARYPSEAAARLVIEWRLRSGDADYLRAYPCRYCGGWHITHKALRTRTEAQDVVVCDSGDATFAQDVV